MDEMSRPVVSEFTFQANAFAIAPVMHAAATLERFVAILPTSSEQRWCDVACGPGIVSRTLAGRVGEVVGVDLTPAMVKKAQEEAEREGWDNVHFLEGDATHLPFPDLSFDGAVTRFSFHHIPVPERVMAEMARIVRPGGTVAVADHLTSSHGAVAAWHQEIERLRDPSHWACLDAERLFAMGRKLGLRLVRHRLEPFTLDWEEWLQRGSGGAAHRKLIERLLLEAPSGADEVFSVSGGELTLLLGVGVWRREDMR